MIVKITKIKEADNPLHPNNIEEGFEKTGEFVAEPKVGEPFLLSWDWGTSNVVKIIDDNTFETHNSIYRWEIMKKI